MNTEPTNQAFIDAQNLYLGTTNASPSWKIDLKRFRIYLERKYNISEAYYFFGAHNSDNVDLYDTIQRAGFILRFREHSSVMTGRKKGNVDTDVVFTIMENMEKLYYREKFDKVVLVSGDGDYKKLVDFLIKEGRLEKVLFPARKSASSLYRSIPESYKDYLDSEGLRNKVGYKRIEKNKMQVHLR